MVRPIVRGTDQLRHPGITDERGASAILFPIDHPREEDTRLGHEESPGLQQQLHTKRARRFHHDGGEGGEIRSLLRLVDRRQPTADIQIRQGCAEPLEAPCDLHQPVSPVPIGIERMELRSHMHVEGEQSKMRRGQHLTPHRLDLADRDPELVPLLPRGDEAMRIGDIHLGIHTQTDRRDHAERSGDRRQQRHLRRRLDIDQLDPGTERLAQLMRLLPHPAEDDLRRRKAGRERLGHFTAGDHVAPAPRFADHRQDPATGIGLERVVQLVRDPLERRAEPSDPLADHRRRIHIGRRTGPLGDRSERHRVDDQRPRTLRESPHQYALAQITSYLAGSPVTRQVVGASAERNSGSGITRIVALVSSFTLASIAGSPFHPA